MTGHLSSCMWNLRFWGTMHRGVSAPSCCAFIHRVTFEEVTGHRDLINSGPGNRGLSACGTNTRLRLDFPRETGLILRFAGKSGNPFQTKQGNRPSCRHQEGRRGSAEAVLGTSMFSSSETGVSGKFGGRIKGAKYRFTLQDGTWDFPGDAIADRGLIFR